MQRYGGISRYFANLNNGINKLPGQSSSISAFYSENEYIKNNGLPLNNALGRRLFNGHMNRIARWNRRYTQQVIKAGNFDVLHPTYYDPYFVPFLNKPFVLTVHDMIHELLPPFASDAEEVKEQKRITIKAADKIIAISENTKRDIIKFYPEAESKIEVVYHGYVPTVSEPITLTLPEKYILFVGERWHYKNFTRLVNALSGLLQKDPELSLLCIGGGAFNESEKALFAKYGIAAKCLQINATDEVLTKAYQRAQLLVFPSLLEGFGLPLLEAFANNCPVVCSNTSSMPEVGGDAARYFDPRDETDIQNAVQKVLYDDALQQRFKAKGLEQLALFSFDTCLQNTVKVYETLL